MEAYLEYLLGNGFPFSDGVVAVVWLGLFAASHLASIKAREAAARQTHMKSSDPMRLLSRSNQRVIVMQFLLAGAIFGFSRFVPAPFFVFIGGAWLCMSAVSIASSLQAVRFYDGLGQPGAATGSLTFSDRFVLQNAASRLFGAAMFCFLAGLFLAHLALFGAAVYLVATARGYIRKASRAPSL